MHYLRKYGFLFVVIISLIFPFIFYSTSLSPRKELSLIERVLYVISRPFEFGLNYVVSSTHSLFHSYFELRDAREEADTLKKQNSELELKLKVLSDITTENARLRKLLQLSQRTEVKFLASEVTSADPSFVYKSVSINKGSSHGVLPGMGVVSSDGVVGVVMRTLTTTADVLIITDPNSNIDVIVARNRRRGILQGGLSNTMHFKFLERGNRILIGDEIVTSGLTGAFPTGLPVGKVTDIKMSSDGVNQIIEVEPSVSFIDISEALVLLMPNREADVIRRIGGIEWMQRLVESNTEKGSGL